MSGEFFSGFGFESRGVINISPGEALRLSKKMKVVFIDVRENYHSFLHTFDVEELYYCPFSDLSEHLDKIPSDQPVIIADAAGMKSIEVVKILQEKGFTNIANLAGGVLEWNNEQLPVKSDKTQRMSGSCMCMLKYREISKINLPDIKPE